jgi:two-component system KDP operon response regulator KdpE
MTQAKIAQAAPKVLVICKCPDTGPAWAYCLRQKQMQVILETSPTNVLQRMADQTPDLLIIDLAKLGTGVFTSIKNLIKDLRGETANPILLLASRQDEEYILEMYNVGVDEYIVKPISPAIFVAKTLAWLRHSWTMPVALLNKIRVGKMSLLPEERMLAIQDRGSIKLTNLELRLLHVLMSDVGKTISTDELISRTWGYSEEADNTLLKNMIYRLRRKMEVNPADPRIILTAPGSGYKFVAD